MSRVMKTLLSAGLSAAMILGTLLPVEAMPLVKAPVAQGNIELVQWGPPGPGYGPPPRLSSPAAAAALFLRSSAAAPGWLVQRSSGLS